MIFVTVGTHEQQFNRLVSAVDNLVNSGSVVEEVFIQLGYSTYEPKCCKWERMLSFDRMQDFMTSADVVITHGGPSSFMEVLALGKTPIVVPRLAVFGEHVNNHQLDFVKEVYNSGKGIIPVYDISELLEAISQARKTIDNYSDNSNNKNFCMQLAKLINKL